MFRLLSPLRDVESCTASQHLKPVLCFKVALLVHGGYIHILGCGISASGNERSFFSALEFIWCSRSTAYTIDRDV